MQNYLSKYFLSLLNIDPKRVFLKKYDFKNALVKLIRDESVRDAFSNY